MIHKNQIRRRLRTAIVTLAIGEHARRTADITLRFMRHYAARTRSSLITLRRPKLGTHAKFEKFQLSEILKSYDRVLYLDCDILIMPNCPDLFKVVPDGAFGAFFDSNATENPADIPKWRNEEIDFFQKSHGDIGWRKTYFNSGVMLIPSCSRHVFDRTLGLNPGKRVIDQTQINYNVQKHGIVTFDIGPSFNYFVALSRSGQQYRDRFQNFILHFAGWDSFYPDIPMIRAIEADAAKIVPLLA